MSSSKKTLLVVLVLVLLAGAAALAWSWSQTDSMTDDSSAVGLTPGAEPLESIAPREAPVTSERTDLQAPTDVVQAADVETTVVFPLVVELALLQRGTFEPLEGMPGLGSGANARMRGTVTGLEGRGLAASVRFIHGPNEGRVLASDATGNFGASDLYQGISIVRVEAGAAGSSEREVLLRQLAETPLNVSFMRPASVAGAVVDGKGQPVEGASVRIDGGESVTDTEGGFYFPRVSAGKVLAVVRKDGYALYRETVPIEMGGAVVRDRMTFTLRPSAPLEVSVAERVGTGPCKLYLFPAGGQRVNDAVGQRTFPWHLVSPVEIAPGGVVRIDGLADGSVTMMLFQAGAIARPPFVNKRLFEGRENAIVMHLEPTPVVRGTVKGPGGEPVPNAKVVLEAPDRGMTTTKILQQRPTFNMEMVLPHLPAALQEARSDGRGRFALTAYEELRNGAYLSAESSDGKLRGTRVVPPGAADVELVLKPVADGGGELEVRLAGRYQGLPVQVRVDGAPRDPLVLAAGKELVIGDLEAGTWRVDVSWEGQYQVQHKRIEIAPGARSGVDAVLPQGALHGQTAEQRKRAGR